MFEQIWTKVVWCFNQTCQWMKAKAFHRHLLLKLVLPFSSWSNTVHTILFIMKHRRKFFECLQWRTFLLLFPQFDYNSDLSPQLELEPQLQLKWSWKPTSFENQGQCAISQMGCCRNILLLLKYMDNNHHHQHRHHRYQKIIIIMEWP